MPGRILIIDDIATNRIIMKVKFSAAYYQVSLASDAKTALEIAARETPDLILLDMHLPDMDGVSICKLLKSSPKTAMIPIIMTTSRRETSGRMEALNAGAEEVLCKPLDELTLLARVRSLLRARDAEEELELRDGTSRALGFAEASAQFTRPASVAIVTSKDFPGSDLADAIKTGLNAQTTTVTKQQVLSARGALTPYDIYILSADAQNPDDGLQLLSELRTHSATRYAAILMIVPQNAKKTAAMALDLGVNDLLIEGFEVEEFRLRLKTQIRRKAAADRLRATVNTSMTAAVTDPLTGLYNRRYALPHLDRMAKHAEATKRSYALMLIDLDHFKRVNDTYGHSAGDTVLRELAKRLSDNIRTVDLLARIGGEEFLLAMPDTDLFEAKSAARRVCRTVNKTPFQLAGNINLTVSVSIGVALGGIEGAAYAPVQNLFDLADEALYDAKADGRNQVMIGTSAA